MIMFTRYRVRCRRCRHRCVIAAILLCIVLMLDFSCLLVSRSQRIVSFVEDEKEEGRKKSNETGIALRGSKSVMNERNYIRNPNFSQLLPICITTIFAVTYFNIFRQNGVFLQNKSVSIDMI